MKTGKIEVDVVMVVRRKFSFDNYDQVSETLDKLTNRSERDKVDAIGTFIYPSGADEEPKSDDYESVKFYAVLSNTNDNTNI